MVGSMYFPSIKELFLAHPPPKDLTTWSGAPMQLATETIPLRRLFDVHLKPVGAAAPMAV
jgi:hypothetical protein